MYHPDFDLSELQEATGREKEFIECYRRWLDKTDPDHHIHIHDQMNYGTKENDRYLRLQIKWGKKRFEQQWRLYYRHNFDDIKKKAIAVRDTLPFELFATVARRGKLGVPWIYKTPRKTGYSYRCSLDGKYFGSKEYADPFGAAVKHMFDLKGIEYPRYLFN